MQVCATNTENPMAVLPRKLTKMTYLFKCGYFSSNSPFWKSRDKYKFEYTWKSFKNVVTGEGEGLLYIQMKNSTIYSQDLAA